MQELLKYDILIFAIVPPLPMPLVMMLHPSNHDVPRHKTTGTLIVKRQKNFLFLFKRPILLMGGLARFTTYVPVYSRRKLWLITVTVQGRREV
jgi:hypothetical protein